jgi:Tol biopolymer transport system component
MPDVNQLFRAATQNARPAPGALTRQLEAQRRRARNRKMSALAVAAVIVAAIAVFVATTLNRGRDGSTPAVPPGGHGLSLTVVGLDGSVRSSTLLPKGAMTPAISPDGTSVAFVMLDGPISRIATMQLDGEGFRIITEGPSSAVRPRWSPDGSELVFYRVDRLSREQGFDVLHLMVMNRDGTNVREISGTHKPDNLPPDWSPDGSLILYSSMYAISGTLYDDLATIPAAGGRSHRLTTTGTIDEAGGDWSPDGHSIAYKRLDGGDWEIWVMNADGSGQHLLAALPHANAEAPDWSPDGSMVAFIGSAGGVNGNGQGHGGAYVVDVATGEVTQILDSVATGNLDSIIDARSTWLPSGDALLVMTGTP